MSLKRTAFCLVVVAALAACGPENNESEPNNTSSSNNTTSNNTTSNNTTSNNTTSNNTTSNNTTSNNTTSNNTTANNTSSTNNETVPPPMCATQDDNCFSNEDCPSDQRCEGGSANSDLAGCCVIGERGSGAVGDQCDSENDCESGICIGRNESAPICSQFCDMENPCPGDLECQAVLGLCVTPDP